MGSEALAQLLCKTCIVERHDAARILGRLGPHERRAIVRERKNGEGPGGPEMLLGTAFMRQLVPDRGDDAHLAIFPAMGRDAGRRSRARILAVGGDDEVGLHALASLGRDPRQSGSEMVIR